MPARWFSRSFLLLSSFPAAALQRVQDRDRGHSHPPLCQQGSRLWCVNTSRTSRISRTSRVLTHFTSVSFPVFTFPFCVSIFSFRFFLSIWLYWVAVLEPERVVVHAVMAGSAVVIFSFTNPSGAFAKASQVIQIFTSSHRPLVQIIQTTKQSNQTHHQILKLSNNQIIK